MVRVLRNTTVRKVNGKDNMPSTRRKKHSVELGGCPLSFGRDAPVFQLSRTQTIQQYLQVVDLNNTGACTNMNKNEQGFADDECSIKLKCPTDYFLQSPECEIITDQPCQITEAKRANTTPHRIKLEPSAVPENANNPAVDPRAAKSLSSKVAGKSANISTNHVITDYFPVRRSNRRPKRIVLAEKKRSLEDAIKCDEEEGLEICYIEGKGRGIAATHSFRRGDYVLEYRGDLIDDTEAKRREYMYARDNNAGCYMYYFKYKNRQYCVDATAESKYLGRLVNHSRTGNLQTRIEAVAEKPHLVFIAKEDIDIGQELTYDYGDRSKESLMHHPWLAL